MSTENNNSSNAAGAGSANAEDAKNAGEPVYYHEFKPEMWKLRNANKKELKAGAIQIYPDYNCGFQLDDGNKTKLPFGISAPYDEKERDGKRARVLPEHHPTMQKQEASAAIALLDPKMVSFFKNEFVEQFLDKVLAITDNEEVVDGLTFKQKMFQLCLGGTSKEHAKMKPEDIKEKLRSKIVSFVNTKDGYDPVIHLTLKWENEMKVYSSRLFTTDVKRLEESKKDPGNPEKDPFVPVRPDSKLCDLMKMTELKDCNTMVIMALDRVTVNKQGAIYFSFKAKMMAVILGTSKVTTNSFRMPAGPAGPAGAAAKSSSSKKEVSSEPESAKAASTSLATSTNKKDAEDDEDAPMKASESPKKSPKKVESLAPPSTAAKSDDKADKTEKSDKADKADKADKSDKADKVDKAEKAEKAEKKTKSKKPSAAMSD